MAKARPAEVAAVVYAWAGIKKRRSMTSVFLSAFYLLLYTCTTMNAL